MHREERESAMDATQFECDRIKCDRRLMFICSRSALESSFVASVQRFKLIHLSLCIFNVRFYLIYFACTHARTLVHSHSIAHALCILCFILSWLFLSLFTFFSHFSSLLRQLLPSLYQFLLPSVQFQRSFDLFRHLSVLNLSFPFWIYETAQNAQQQQQKRNLLPNLYLRILYDNLRFLLLIRESRIQ